MCTEKTRCKRTDSPELCSKEQIKKCHGDVAFHPCVPDAGKARHATTAKGESNAKR